MSTSLQKYDRIADRLKLARQADTRPAAVVEGKTDRLFLERLAPRLGVSVYVAGTRRVVLETARDVSQLGLDRVACIVDRDFDDEVLLAETDGLPIAPYDNADLESMLWHSISLDRVLDEIGSAQKLARYGGVAALRSKTLDVLRPLARLRYASATQHWGLSFGELNLASKIDLNTLDLSVQSLCDALWNEDLPIGKAELYATASAEGGPKCPATATDLVRGRDALAVAGVALRRLVGNLRQQQVAPERLEETLRLSATEGSLASTSWLERIMRLLAA